MTKLLKFLGVLGVIISIFTGMLISNQVVNVQADTVLTAVNAARQEQHMGDNRKSVGQADKNNYFERYGLYMLVGAIISILLMFEYVKHRQRI